MGLLLVLSACAAPGSVPVAARPASAPSSSSSAPTPSEEQVEHQLRSVVPCTDIQGFLGAAALAEVTILPSATAAVRDCLGDMDGKVVAAGLSASFRGHNRAARTTFTRYARQCFSAEVT